MAMDSTIELLSPQLLAQHPAKLKEMDDLRLSLGLDLGWHYPLDIIWILGKIDLLPECKVILDAGAGKGLLQFAMAERGYRVVSVDFSERHMQLPIRLAYPIQVLKGQVSAGEYLDHMSSKYSKELPSVNSQLISIKRMADKAKRFLLALVRLPLFLSKRRMRRIKIGSILVHWSNILDMQYLEDASIDCIVSLSAIEHMKKTEIEKAMKEFRRVLKPDGAIIITTNAAKDHDWYHEPSMGWCFSEQSVREIFGLDQRYPSNWDEYDAILEQIRISVELKRRLSPSYAFSGKNGMPWGVWDPQYVPVGLFVQIS
jgi:ubiquinone/menaquinone biosynthesis C-methylase UbiE